MTLTQTFDRLFLDRDVLPRIQGVGLAADLDKAATVQHREKFAVSPAHLRLVTGEGSFGLKQVDVAVAIPAIGPYVQFDRSPADCLFAGIAECRESCLIHFRKPPFRQGEQADDDGALVEDAAEPFFTFAERDGSGLGLLHRAVVNAGVVQDEGSLLRQHDTVLYFFIAERMFWRCAAQSENAKTARTVEDGENRDCAPRRTVINLAVFLNLRVVVHDDRLAGVVRLLGKLSFIPAHPVAQEKGLVSCKSPHHKLVPVHER